MNQQQVTLWGYQRLLFLGLLQTGTCHSVRVVVQPSHCFVVPTVALSRMYEQAMNPPQLPSHISSVVTGRQISRELAS